MIHWVFISFKRHGYAYHLSYMTLTLGLWAADSVKGIFGMGMFY